MEQDTQPQEPTHKELWIDRHKVLTGIGITIAFIVFLGLIASLNKSNSTTGSPVTSQTATDTPEVQTTPEPTRPTLTTSPTEAKKGLNISRNKVISGIQKADPNIEFKAGNPYKGQENYVGGQGQNIIQLLGSAVELTVISSTAIIGDDSSENLKALVYVVGIASVVDTNANDWVTGAMGEIRDGMKNGETSIGKSTVINHRKYKLSYQKNDILTSLSIIIDPAE